MTDLKQVPCENVDYLLWENFKLAFKTCSIKESAIDADDVEIFSETVSSIMGVDFYDNEKVSFLPINLHVKFPNLTTLTASFCDVKTVANKNFKHLTKLRLLWLEGNQIEQIPSNAFEDLTALEVLNLSRSKDLIYL